MSLTVRTATPEERRVAFDTVLAPSFVFDELEPYEEFDTKLEDGTTTLLVGVDDAGAIVAAAVFVNIRAASAVVLRQMATREDVRGTGLGTELYRAFIATLEESEQPSLVLAEVQHPDHHEAHPRHGDPLSRLRFYDRFDARIIDVPYYKPALAPGLKPVYGLLLLALYVRPDLINPARTYLDPPENLLFALRSLLYADGDPDEAAAAALLSAASRNRVRLLPTSEYARVTPGLPPTGEN
jgi:GNAT superfamily N-acetyltransferase